MNINCTCKCAHQSDGKCTLNSLVNLTHTGVTLNDFGCPYYTVQ